LGQYVLQHFDYVNPYAVACRQVADLDANRARSQQDGGADAFCIQPSQDIYGVAALPQRKDAWKPDPFNRRRDWCGPGGQNQSIVRVRRSVGRSDLLLRVIQLLCPGINEANILIREHRIIFVGWLDHNVAATDVGGCTTGQEAFFVRFPDNVTSSSGRSFFRASAANAPVPEQPITTIYWAVFISDSSFSLFPNYPLRHGIVA